MNITYDEAVAADARGEKVEMNLHHANWRSFNLGIACPCCCQFRIAEPADRYAHLKAAQAAGKVIQRFYDNGKWADLFGEIGWAYPPDRYRIKPDELKIERDQAYRNSIGEKVVVKSTTSRHHEGFPVIGEVYVGDRVLMTRLYRIDGTSMGDKFSLVAPWTDTPASYDNWDKVPAWAMWQAVDKDGSWWWYAKKPEKATQGWANHFAVPNSTPTPTEFAPTNFTGTWEESLQERP